MHSSSSLSVLITTRRRPTREAHAQGIGVTLAFGSLLLTGIAAFAWIPDSSVQSCGIAAMLLSLNLFVLAGLWCWCSPVPRLPLPDDSLPRLRQVRMPVGEAPVVWMGWWRQQAALGHSLGLHPWAAKCDRRADVIAAALPAGTALRALLGLLLLGTSACSELAPVVKESLGTTETPGVYHLTLVVEGTVVMAAQGYAGRAATRHSEAAACALVADPVTATQTQATVKKEGEAPRQEVRTEIKTLLRCTTGGSHAG